MSDRPIRRYVALGDSFTEGVGDPDPTRPNGVRGWSERTAEVLAARDPGFRYANLAVRGRLLGPIVAEQADRAIALEPDLVTLYAGGNDLLRPALDLDALVAEYDAMVARLTATGARVLLWTAYDGSWAPLFGRLRGRWAVYNELVREVADRHGATIVDFWRFREYRDLRMWDDDRLHMSPLGHRAMAIRVLATLGITDHGIDPVVLPDGPVTDRARDRRDDVRWVRSFVVPWVARRVRGTSSGDGIGAKYPTPSVPVALR